MQPHDALGQSLARLQVPEPPANAQEAILQAAKAQPRKQFTPFAALRRFRAMLYIPQTRYAIMASVVAIVIGLGIWRQSQPAAQRIASIPTDVLLYDVEFAEFEGEPDWLNGSAG